MIVRRSAALGIRSHLKAVATLWSAGLLKTGAAFAQLIKILSNGCVANIGEAVLF